MSNTYLPFNFDPIETKTISSAIQSSYTVPANRYALVKISGANASIIFKGIDIWCHNAGLSTIGASATVDAGDPSSNPNTFLFYCPFSGPVRIEISANAFRTRLKDSSSNIIYDSGNGSYLNYYDLGVQNVHTNFFLTAGDTGGTQTFSGTFTPQTRDNLKDLWLKSGETLTFRNFTGGVTLAVAEYGMTI